MQVLWNRKDFDCQPVDCFANLDRLQDFLALSG